MLKGRGMSIWVLVVTLAIIVWYIFQSGPAPLQTPGHINVLEQVTLGGVRQWISIRAADPHAPVLLFLHGGPGSANLAKLRLQTPDLEQHFVVVAWDQPGAGKSASLGFNYNRLSIEQMVADAHELVAYLKARFGVEKIYSDGFLVGHGDRPVIGSASTRRISWPSSVSARWSIRAKASGSRWNLSGKKPRRPAMRVP
jgi:hypothetical protein